MKGNVMSKKARIKMTKPQHRATALANVLPEHVETWEDAGWKQEKPPKKTTEGDK